MDKPEEKSALDSLEQKLYDPKEELSGISPHHVRDRKEKELPTSWGNTDQIIHPVEEHTGLSFGAKFLIGATLLLACVLIFTAWRVLSARNVVSERNIDMVLDIAPYVEGGEITPFVVSLTNNNDVELTEASLTIMYKKGTGAQDEEDRVQVRRSLGTIGAGELKRQDFEVSLYGSESESRDITAKLDFKVKGSNAVFSKVGLAQVILKSPPISVHIEGPDTLSVGQSGTFTFLARNNTGTTTEASLLLATLPANFTLEDATPKTTGRGTIWNVKALAPGETASIKITGTFSGNQGEVSTMRALVGSVGGSVTEVGVVYSSHTLDIKLRSSPLLLSYTLETERGGGSGSIRYGDRIRLSINYKNAGKIPLQNVEILLKVTGDAALYKQITSDLGYYDSTAGTIVWNSASVPELVSIAPDKEGIFVIHIPVVTKGTNAPKLMLAMTGTGTAEEQGDVVVTATKTYVVQGSASLAASTKYKSSPFQNVGPIPPEPNVDTTYTVHLVVSAQNALQNAKVSFVLPPYVTWRNISTDTAKTSYDTKTRTVTWNIGSIESGKMTAIDLGLSVRPSQVHVGTMPAITGGIVLDADEVESRAHLRTTLSGLTTYIEGESWPSNPSVVVDR